jgi:hypothetical protein
MDLTYEEAEIMYNVLGSYIHTEKNCNNGVNSQYLNLHTKLGEYLHG